MLFYLTVIAIMIFILISPYLIKKYLNLEDFTGLGSGILCSLSQIIIFGIIGYIMIGNVNYNNFSNYIYAHKILFNFFILIVSTVFILSHYYFLKMLYQPNQNKGVIFMYISGNILLFDILMILSLSQPHIIYSNLSFSQSLLYSFYLIIIFIVFLMFYIGLPVCIYYYHKTNDIKLFYLCIFFNYGDIIFLIINITLLVILIPLFNSIYALYLYCTDNQNTNDNNYYTPSIGNW